MINSRCTPYPRIRIAQPQWFAAFGKIFLDMLFELILILPLCLCCYYLCRRCDGLTGLVVSIVFVNISFLVFGLVRKLLMKVKAIKYSYNLILAKLGFPCALYELGSMYLSEFGFEKAKEMAVRWLLKAAERGDVFAMWKLARIYSYNDALASNLRKAYEYLISAAEGGLVGAQCAIGCCYEYGYGVEKDPAKAAMWYLRAANYGLAPAQHNIGYCYKMGIGVDKDEDKAEEWFDSASKQFFYDNGRSKDNGTEKDYAVIELWDLALLSCQPEWNRQFSDGFLCEELRSSNRSLLSR